MKKNVSIIVLISVLCFIACGSIGYEKESSKAPSEENMEIVQSMDETVTEETETSESYKVEPNVEADEYDYECYLRGIYLTADGKDDKLYIHPVHYINMSDPEEVKKYGLEVRESGPVYEILDDNEELIKLSINEETEFLVINWRHEQELADNSINHAIVGWCLLKDPMYFWKHMQDEYGDGLLKYPMFITMNESGYVDQIVELWLP